MSLVQSKNSPKHLKMCLNLLTGKWMRSQDWERTCLLSGGMVNLTRQIELSAAVGEER